jgi:hypothetical protein
LLLLRRDRSANKRIEVLLKDETKHDSSEETKTYSAIHTKKSAEQHQEQKLEGYYRYQGESYLRHYETSLYTPTFLRHSKNIYKMRQDHDPHAGFKSLCVQGKVLIALVNKDVEDILRKRSTLITE